MSSNNDTKKNYVNVGLSQIFPCSYLNEQQEQLMVIQNQVDSESFDRLLAVGFRRSGNSIYKPKCPNCMACQPIRIPVSDFSPSRRQRRTLKKNKDLVIKISSELTSAYYPLYEKYISLRHQDSTMYPPTKTQFEQFLGAGWMKPKYIELYSAKGLIAVGVTDFLPSSLSAIYTFFDPMEDKRSLGSLMILIQCKLAMNFDKNFVYLGYQIDNNKKMNYKTAYKPYQVLSEQGWKTSEG